MTRKIVFIGTIKRNVDAIQNYTPPHAIFLQTAINLRCNFRHLFWIQLQMRIRHNSDVILFHFHYQG